MLQKIEQWIDQTNLKFEKQRVSCIEFFEQFNGFYSHSFLENAYYVTVDRIPKPDFPELREMGLGDFIDSPANGITYKNTYYLLSHQVANLRLHFHELVHVAQWQHFGAEAFIKRYISEIQSVGYSGAPLEKMAYGLDLHFSKNGRKIDVPTFVAQQL